MVRREFGAVVLVRRRVPGRPFPSPLPALLRGEVEIRDSEFRVMGMAR